jgi:peptidoglycan/LPS O-acetylase OafA/YrhL
LFSGSKYRRDIQVLRGLAVLAVVLFHANQSYFPLGYLGVDVFFVISGFVVTPLILRIFIDQSNTGGALTNLKYFYKRRFYRLAPALAVTLAISAVSIFLLGPTGDHQRFARQGIATLLLLGNAGAYRYSRDYFSPYPNPLVHTWSLSVEEQIYLFLPLIFILILRNRKSLKKITVTILGCISALSFILFLFPAILQPLYSQAGIESAYELWFLSPIHRMWQFTAGGLVYILLDRTPKFSMHLPVRYHLLSVISVVIILFGPIHFGLKANSILAGLFAVLIILFKSLDILPNFLIHKLEWIGDRSYSIYLVHMPLLYLAKYSPATQILSIENRLIQITVAVVASILLGALSYSKIENRYRNQGKNKASGLKSISAALSLTLVLPLILFVIMDRGFKEQYWGLDRNIKQPIYAGTQDPKCLRESEIGPPCFYMTTSATNTVLLIGDSHAGQFAQAVIDAAQSTNWNSVVWTHGGCLVQFKREPSERVSDNCIKINYAMKKWVKANQPHAIIVSQFVQSNSSQKNLRDALSDLQSIVPNIVLIENTPVFPDGGDFMVGRPLIMSPYKAPKKFAQSMMEQKDKIASNQLAKWARDNKISTMNLDSHFCNGEICTRWSDTAGWLYRDDNHLSVAGAELAIPQIITFLKRFNAPLVITSPRQVTSNS